jgi:MFS family permease
MATPGKRKGRVNTFNVLILLFVGLGSMSYGYTASIIGTTLGQPSFISYFELDTRKNGTDLISTTNGLFQAGGVVGTLLLPNISDRYGRKWGIAIVSYLTFIVLLWADEYTECYVSYPIWRFSRRQHRHRRIHRLPLYCRC